jgi:hypothetical protein
MNAKLLMRIVFGLLLLNLAACGTKENLIAVKGQVINDDGKPVKEGSVAIFPNKDKGNNSSVEASGEIKDGTYEAYTKGTKGVPPGHYKVTVMSQTIADSTTPTKAKVLVPEKFTKRETTTLLIEVKDSAAAGAYDLNLK